MKSKIARLIWHQNKSLILKVLDWIFPFMCIACHLKSRDYFCSDCLAELPWLQHCCKVCANELLSPHISNTCGECLIDPPPINRTIVLFHYQFPIISIITKLKFRKKLLYAQALGSLLAKSILPTYQEEQQALPDYIIPVPLHHKRLKQRGYNQALEIARPLKKQLKIPIEYRKVKRIKETAPQTLVSAQERLKNVRKAFQISSNLECTHVAIVDDVITTFSTITELAKTLKRHGVSKIDVWCIAKAG